MDICNYNLTGKFIKFDKSVSNDWYFVRSDDGVIFQTINLHRGNIIINGDWDRENIIQIARLNCFNSVENVSIDTNINFSITVEWVKPEAKELTLKQIEEILGYPIRLI